MTIFSWQYLFAVCLILGAYSFAGKRVKTPLIAIVSGAFILFQAPKNPIHSLVVAGVTAALFIAGWIFGRLVQVLEDPSKKKKSLIVGILISLAPLLFYRYALSLFLFGGYSERGNEFCSNLAPIGISYFTFRIICYLVEIHKGNITSAKPTEYVAYLAFFPTLIAGPIERAKPFFDQIRTNPKADTGDIAIGSKRILQGLLKTLLLGMLCKILANPLINLPANPGAFESQLSVMHPAFIWIGIFGYYGYIYFNFSGYSDIAIGSARLFGIRIMENFRWPILAINISDFWQRWHISLTGWIRDYVYFPLGGSRYGILGRDFNTIIAMVLVGLWHGAGFNLFVFGVYHGTGLIIYRHWRNWKKAVGKGESPKLWGKLAGWSLTTVFFLIGLIIFRFPIEKVSHIIARMFFLI